MALGIASVMVQVMHYCASGDRHGEVCSVRAGVMRVHAWVWPVGIMRASLVLMSLMMAQEAHTQIGFWSIHPPSMYVFH